jgi:hypothetical protein
MKTRIRSDKWRKRIGTMHRGEGVDDKMGGEDEMKEGVRKRG